MRKLGILHTFTPSSSFSSIIITCYGEYIQHGIMTGLQGLPPWLFLPGSAAYLFPNCRHTHTHTTLSPSAAHAFHSDAWWKNAGKIPSYNRSCVRSHHRHVLAFIYYYKEDESENLSEHCEGSSDDMHTRESGRQHKKNLLTAILLLE